MSDAAAEKPERDDEEPRQPDAEVATDEDSAPDAPSPATVEADAAPKKDAAPDEDGASSEDSTSAPEPEAAAPPAPEESEPEPISKPGMHWYVLRVASNKEGQVQTALERKVKIEQLEERIGRILVPMQKEKRMRGGTARIYHRKLYPGYVFVEMATEMDGSIPENVWFLIKETTGVGDFISSGGKPSPMPQHDVEKMLAATVAPDESPTLANLSFKQGDRVKVREGPFENFEGLVDEINTQKGTVRVIVTIFGRATPIEIEYWQVENL